MREGIKLLQDIPNVGPRIEEDLQLLGVHDPAQLPGQDPYKMFNTLCERTGTLHDPCVIDVFISAVRFMEGEPEKNGGRIPASENKHYSIENSSYL